MVITADPCAGIDLENMNLVIYPNPTEAIVYVSFDGELEELILLNPEGKILQQHHQVASPFTLDLSSYPSGLYLLQSRNHSQGLLQRIVKL